MSPKILQDKILDVPQDSIKYALEIRGFSGPAIGAGNSAITIGVQRVPCFPRFLAPRREPCVNLG